jgi:hypothetical protein
MTIAIVPAILAAAERIRSNVMDNVVQFLTRFPIPDAVGISSDILAAATTLAGLVLVFLATEVTRYLGTPGILRDTKMRAKYRRQAWFTFLGFLLAVAAALLALFGKWFQYEPLSLSAAAAFVLSALWAVVAAMRTVGEIVK